MQVDVFSVAVALLLWPALFIVSSSIGLCLAMKCFEWINEKWRT